MEGGWSLVEEGGWQYFEEGNALMMEDLHV